MHIIAAPRPLAVGFLTIVSDPSLGAIGGYLITNRTGRPLEFHCTAPVRPTRAQEILYGPALEPYLFGELIGQALLGKSTASPALVCTDCPAALTAREFVETPLALLVEAGRPAGGLTPVSFRVGSRELAVSTWHAHDQSRIEAALRDIDEGLDLNEPFERIREAIREAQRSAA